MNTPSDIPSSALPEQQTSPQRPRLTDGHDSAAARGLCAAAPWLALLGGGSQIFCLWMILVYAPVESTMRLPQKIFYLHLPLAWWALGSFFVVFLAGIAYLITRKPAWDALAGAAVEVGLLLGVLILATGMLWGRPAWGIWWTWDARLTTSLVMCFVYAGYLIIRSMDMSPQRRAMVCSVIGIIAFLDVPLVFYSARLWSYIHPPSITLAPEMKLTAVVCLVSFAFVWTALLAVRWKLELDKNRLDALAAEQLMRRDEQHADQIQ